MSLICAGGSSHAGTADDFGDCFVSLACQAPDSGKFARVNTSRETRLNERGVWYVVCVCVFAQVKISDHLKGTEAEEQAKDDARSEVRACLLFHTY